jgi:hypothetical protein
MKAVMLPALVGLLLLAAMSATLRFARPWEPARVLLRLYLASLPALIAAYVLTPVDLGFLPPQWIAPSAAVELAFAVFLYSAGFFGGLLQLYNLADRGFSLRIIIDVLTSQDRVATVDQIMTGYGGGRGMSWMYAKRLDGMLLVKLIALDGDRIILTERGARTARLFTWLQGLLNPDHSAWIVSSNK